MRIYINPDREFANEVRRALKDNNGYCPCQLERSPDTKCRCKDFRDQIKRGETGSCHCGLYIAEEE